jgi:hypothetical protein
VRRRREDDRGEETAMEGRGGAGVGRVQAVVGGGGGVTATPGDGLAPAVAAVPHYRVRVWGSVRRRAPLMTPSIEASRGAAGDRRQAIGGTGGWSRTKGGGRRLGVLGSMVDDGGGRSWKDGGSQG